MVFNMDSNSQFWQSINSVPVVQLNAEPTKHFGCGLNVSAQLKAAPKTFVGLLHPLPESTVKIYRFAKKWLIMRNNSFNETNGIIALISWFKRQTIWHCEQWRAHLQAVPVVGLCHKFKMTLSRPWNKSRLTQPFEGAMQKCTWI